MKIDRKKSSLYFTTKAFVKVIVFFSTGNKIIVVRNSNSNNSNRKKIHNKISVVDNHIEWSRKKNGFRLSVLPEKKGKSYTDKIKKGNFSTFILHTFKYSNFFLLFLLLLSTHESFYLPFTSSIKNHTCKHTHTQKGRIFNFFSSWFKWNLCLYIAFSSSISVFLFFLSFINIIYTVISNYSSTRQRHTYKKKIYRHSIRLWCICVKNTTKE